MSKTDPFTLKDSGERQSFTTGAVRDVQEGKGRYDLLSPIVNRRLAIVMEKGAKKYDARNWEKGMPLSRFIDSAKRHLDQFIEGHKDEDHLGQAIWNLCGLLHIQEMIARGILGKELDDLPNYLGKDIVHDEVNVKIKIHPDTFNVEKDYDRAKDQEIFSVLPRSKRDEIIINSFDESKIRGTLYGLPTYRYWFKPVNGGDWHFRDGFIYEKGSLHGYYVDILDRTTKEQNYEVQRKEFQAKPRKERDKILLNTMSDTYGSVGTYLGVSTYLFYEEPKNSSFNTYNDGIIRNHETGELFGYYVVKKED